MARGTGAQLTEEQLEAGAIRFQILEREEDAGIFDTLKTAIINLPLSTFMLAGDVGEILLLQPQLLHHPFLLLYLHQSLQLV